MLIDRFLEQSDFDSYEDFLTHLRLRVPERFNFAYDVVDEIAARQPDRRALVWRNDRGAEAVFSFADMAEQSCRAANAFAGMGIGRGDPVMLMLKRRHQYWPCLLALHRLGAVAIPATHLLTGRDLLFQISAASVVAIVAVDEAAVLDAIDAAAAEAPCLRHRLCVRATRSGWVSLEEAMARAAPRFERRATSNDDTSLLYFTSGTSGMPKMVQLDFTYPLGHLLTAKYWQAVLDGGLHLTVADTGWAKAAWGKIYGQWLCGSAVFVYDHDRFVATELLDAIERYGVSTFCAPPTIYRFLIKEDLRRRSLAALRSCTVAGEPLNPEVYRRFYDATGLRLREGYGQTEMTAAIAVFPWTPPKPGSMGVPSPGYDVDLVNEEGRPCEVGEKGEIVIRTDRRVPVGMFRGYYRDPGLTQKVWHDGRYHTGDMAWRDEDGWIWFVGRADEVIKSSGYRIGPFEVESALMEHGAVLECAVTGVADPDRGQAVKATVVLAKGWQPSPELATELQEHVEKTTAPYKYPRIVEFALELPKTISGKIRRGAIGSPQPPGP